MVRVNCAVYVRKSTEKGLELEFNSLHNQEDACRSYNAGKVGLMSINDNNRLIVRALAYAWRFKKLYEKGVRMEDIMKQEKMTKRTIYKYLNLAYLSPRIVNQLLSGTLTINLQTLFDIASKNLSFEEQYNICKKFLE